MTPLSSPLAMPIALSKRLSEILETENEMLRSRRPREIAQLQEEKSQLALRFSREMDALRNNSNLIENAAESERNELRESSQRFQDALKENQRLLFATKSVTEGIIRAVANEVEKVGSRAAGYNKRAGMNKLSPNKPTSLTLNQTI